MLAMSSHMWPAAVTGGTPRSRHRARWKSTTLAVASLRNSAVRTGSSMRS